MRAMIVRVVQVTLVAAALAGGSIAAQQPGPQVTAQDLREGLKNPTRWITYGGDYANHRHSPLTQITPENVQRLTAQWAFQTDTLGKFEAAPLVLDGVIYILDRSTPAGLDARTGRQIWRYRRDLPSGLIARCGWSIAASACSAVASSTQRSTPTSSRSAARPARFSGTRRWRTIATATAGRPRRWS
jgi:glucose dehydrogenase